MVVTNLMKFNWFKKKSSLSSENISVFIDSLSIEKAKRMFLMIVANDQKKRYVEFELSDEKNLGEGINSCVVDFFNEFNEVNLSGISLSVEMIGLSNNYPEFKKIGEDGFFDIVSNKINCKVHYIDDEDTLALSGTQKSVWHYLVNRLFQSYSELAEKYIQSMGPKE